MEGQSASQSAILSFSTSNVRSYRDETEISLVASRLAEPGITRKVQSDSTGRTVAVLPVAGIFGPNASGKSTILRSMVDMRSLVVGSFRQGDASTPIPRKHFRLDTTSIGKPTRFEIDLVLNGVRWQYGFEFDSRSVIAEYAFHFPKGRQRSVFERQGNTISFGPAFRSDGGVLKRLLRPNALLLSVAGAAGQTSLTSLFGWFQSNFLLAESRNRPDRTLRTAGLANSGESRERVLALLCAADLGITDISREPVPEELRSQLESALSGDHEEDGKKTRLFIAHRLQLTHCGDETFVDFDTEDESLGTMVWVGLVGPVLDALDSGSVLLADELDASLHPNLVDRIVALFQNPATNPNSAQLIFNAHDVTVLGDSDKRRLGRDQIWFTEKDDAGATALYSLADFSPRKDEALERRYMQGRFGALPVLDPGEFERATALIES